MLHHLDVDSYHGIMRGLFNPSGYALTYVSIMLISYYCHHILKDSLLLLLYLYNFSHASLDSSFILTTILASPGPILLP